ncbi:MAG: pyridoxamine kinase [Clostridia bacterium]|nr:pyridoxamine kinase [Clostridia bacterium]
MKRIVTIQDISCVGKCSLTVALPVISACGVEAAVIPTAMLSTHTAFRDFTFCDLTEEITPVSEHLKKENISFDAIYTGYLGSFRQLRLMNKFFDDFGTDDNIIFIDPVMGDRGRLYPGFTQEFADSMARLCARADVIVPNLTEACYMLHEEYIESGYNEEYIKNILRRLADLGCKNAVLTGVSFEEGKLGVMAYNKERDEFSSYYTEKVNESFHGTGDVFSSACIGALMRGLSLEAALKTAVNYTLESIRATMREENHNWYGVNFEEAIPFLIEEIKNNKNESIVKQ